MDEKTVNAPEVSSRRHGQKVTKVWRPVASQQMKSDNRTPAPEEPSTKSASSDQSSGFKGYKAGFKGYSRRRRPVVSQQPKSDNTIPAPEEISTKSTSSSSDQVSGFNGYEAGDNGYSRRRRPVVSQKPKSDNTKPAPEEISTKSTSSSSDQVSGFNGYEAGDKGYSKRGLSKWGNQCAENVQLNAKGHTGKMQWIRKGAKGEELLSGNKSEASASSGKNSRFSNHSEVQNNHADSGSNTEQIGGNNYGSGSADTGVSSNTEKGENEFMERASSSYSSQGVGEKTFIHGVSSNTEKGENEFMERASSSYSSQGVGEKTFISKIKHETHQQDKSQARDSPNFTTKKDDPAQKRKIEAILKACDKWRMRGNEAYGNQNLCKAEEFYTEGINSIPPDEKTECYLKPLVLCYSNRAAVRMSCNKLREALGDCKTAASLDPSFLKVQIRAAKCHLSLGEVEDALSTFKTCLGSSNAVCSDKKISMEAVNGMKNAKKVAEYLDSCNGLLQQRSSNAATSALSIVLEALSICSHSERLLEMKGEALFMLRRYEDVIELCKQTLNFAVENFIPKDNQDVSRNLSVKFWRSLLTFKCHFHMGKLELAIDVLEQIEKMRSSGDEYRSNIMKLSIPSVFTLRGVIENKKAGNKAFKLGKYGDAVEYYTASITNGIQSRPFASICFCNRAAAHGALNQIADAIADCSLAIALDENYLKPVSRRAALHERIGDYDQAIIDLQTIVSIVENKLQDNLKLYDLSDCFMDKDLELELLIEARDELLLMQEKAKGRPSLKHQLILGIDSCGESEIRKAYRKLALRHHPDKTGQLLARNENGEEEELWKEIADKVYKDADRLFKLIGEANTVLTDRAKKKSLYE